MDTTIRNLDEDAYRRLKARAALEGRPIGVVLSDIIREASGTGADWPKRGSTMDIKPEPFGKGTEHLSEQIDEIVYGVPPRKPAASGPPPTFKRPPPRSGKFVNDPMKILELSPRRKSTHAKRKASKR